MMGPGMPTSSAALSMLITMLTPTVRFHSLIQTSFCSLPFLMIRSNLWMSPDVLPSHVVSRSIL